MKKTFHRYFSSLKDKNLTFLLTLIMVGVFVSIVLPLCFNNNDYLNLVYANNVDSGSILGGILELFRTSGQHTFYNQNLIFHGVYGYPYNSLVFWLFALIKLLIGIRATDHFTIFASVARLTNLFISVLVILQLHRTGMLYLNRLYIRIGYILLVIVFPPFLFYSFQMKQDLFGLYFSLLCFNSLYRYIVLGKKDSLWKSIVFFALAALNKQPFVFFLIPLILLVGHKAITGDRAELSIQIAKGIIVSLFLSFAIHPYMFLDVQGFIDRQSILFNGNIAQSTSVTVQEWIGLIEQSSYLQIVCVVPFLFIIHMGATYFLRRKISFQKKEWLLLSISFYIPVYIAWLILKVGPLKIEAYFIPVYAYSLLLIMYLAECYLNKMTAIDVFRYIRRSTILTSLMTVSFWTTIIFLSYKPLLKIYDESYAFKQRSVVQIANKINDFDFGVPKKTINMVHTVSIPINSALFKSVKNTWQFGDVRSMQQSICVTFKPDVVVLEKNYPYEINYKIWSEILIKCKLTNRYTQNSDFALFY